HITRYRVRDRSAKAGHRGLIASGPPRGTSHAPLGRCSGPSGDAERRSLSMANASVNTVVTIMSAGALVTAFLAPSAVTGADAPADAKGRVQRAARASVTPSPTLASMSARTVALPLDEF